MTETDAGRCDGSENHDYYIIGGDDDTFAIGCKNDDCRWSDEQVASVRTHLAGMPDTRIVAGSYNPDMAMRARGFSALSLPAKEVWYRIEHDLPSGDVQRFVLRADSFLLHIDEPLRRGKVLT